MTRTRPPQVAFSAGEIDPLLHAREDFQRFQSGLARCRGFVPLRQGGFTRAPGTIFRGSTRGDLPAVRFAFQFAANDTLALEFTDTRMRVWRYGALVLSGATPFELVTPWTTADLPNLRFAQDADVIYVADGRQPVMQLSRLALDNWTLTAAAFDDGPFRVQNLDEDRTVQCSAVFGAIAAWEPLQQLTIGAARKFADNVYVFRGVGSDLLTATNGQVNAVAPTHGTGTTSYTGQVNGVDVTVWWEFSYSTLILGNVNLTGTGDIFTAADLGRLFLLQPEDVDVPLWVGNYTFSLSASTGNPYWPVDGLDKLTKTTSPAPLVFYDGRIYQLIEGLATGLTPPTHASGDRRGSADKATRYRFVSDLEGVLRIATVTDANTATAEVLKAVPPPCVDTPTYRWSRGAWGADYGHPAALALYEQRLFLARTPSEPRTLWASVIGAYRSFAPGGEADDSFAWDIGGNGSKNEIVWLYPARGGIYIATLGEVRLGRSATSGQAIGPTTFTAELVASGGASSALPVSPHGWPIHISSDRTRLQEIRYNLQDDTTRPVDLSLPSQHLGADRFEQIVWQLTPESRGWLRNGKGELVTIVYDPDQDVLGWAVVPLAGGFAEHLDVTKTADGTRDVVTAIVRRTVDGQTRRYIEELADIHAPMTGAAPVTDFVHGFASGVFAPDPAAATFSLPQLAGQTVYAWTDRGAYGPLTVAGDGLVTLPDPVTRAVIGMHDATHVARTLPIRAAANDGDTRGRGRRLHTPATLFLHHSNGGSIRTVERDKGREFAGPAREIVPADVLQNDTLTWSGLYPVTALSGYADEVALEVIPDGLRPLTLLASVPDVEETGA